MFPPEESETSTDVTEESSIPIQILLYPPQNKQFKFDKDTNQIEIQPKTSTLTPLIEECNINLKNLMQFENTDTNVQEVVKIEKVFSENRLGKNCFLKGCKWSGDGLCLLTNSEDNTLRLFEVTEDLMRCPADVWPVLQMKEGGTIYDYTWYPRMNSSDPVTCVFACTSQNSPIHLWDAYTGQIRATYQPINQYDEVISAYSLAFSPDGTKLYSGFKKSLKVFDISTPGRISEERSLKTKGNSVFQTNIISCISVNPFSPDLYALGSYDKTIGLYSENDGNLICILRGHSGGVTQIIFSSNGFYLFSGGRKDDEILCWDIRNPGKIVFSIMRKVETQQKIQFDLSADQRYLITGTTDGQIKLYDVYDPAVPTDNILKEKLCWNGHEDCVNGVQFHPSLPLFASSSGQRHLLEFKDEEEEEGKLEKKIENCVKIWKYS